ncbi:hypothetical protein BH11ARM2_BH11ARM2_10190 [soil metagenome]
MEKEKTLAEELGLDFSAYPFMPQHPLTGAEWRERQKEQRLSAISSERWREICDKFARDHDAWVRSQTH